MITVGLVAFMDGSRLVGWYLLLDDYDAGLVAVSPLTDAQH